MLFSMVVFILVSDVMFKLTMNSNSNEFCQFRTKSVACGTEIEALLALAYVAHLEASIRETRVPQVVVNWNIVPLLVSRFCCVIMAIQFNRNRDSI